MDGPAIFRIGTGRFTGTRWFPAGKGALRTFKFGPPFCLFCAVPVHGMPLWADGDPIGIDCKILCIDRRTATFVVQVNKGSDPMFHTVLIIRHSIVGRIEDDLLYNNIGQELFYGIPCVKEPVCL